MSLVLSNDFLLYSGFFLATWTAHFSINFELLPCNNTETRSHVVQLCYSNRKYQGRYFTVTPMIFVRDTKLVALCNAGWSSCVLRKITLNELLRLYHFHHVTSEGSSTYPEVDAIVGRAGLVRKKYAPLEERLLQ